MKNEIINVNGFLVSAGISKDGIKELNELWWKNPIDTPIYCCTTDFLIEEIAGTSDLQMPIDEDDVFLLENRLLYFSANDAIKRSKAMIGLNPFEKYKVDISFDIKKAIDGRFSLDEIISYQEPFFEGEHDLCIDFISDDNDTFNNDCTYTMKDIIERGNEYYKKLLFHAIRFNLIFKTKEDAINRSIELAKFK